MKKVLFLQILTSMFLTSNSQIPIPEFVNKVQYLKSDNTLGNLETSDASVDYKMLGMGYGGMEVYYTAFPGTSDVSFKHGEVPKFVIKVEDGVDPSEFLSLSIGDQKKKDRRRFKQGSFSATGNTRDNSMFTVPLDFKKIEPNVYEIIPENDLKPGEYAFVRILNQQNQSGVKIKIYCFRID